MKRVFFLAAATFAPLLFAAPVGATVVVVPELPELAQKSGVIVHAVVTDVTTVQEPDGRLVTKTTLAVKDGIKGVKAGEQTLVVHQVGGELNGKVMRISGAHRFKKGEELVLFGERWPRYGEAALMPFGVGYGVFDVVEDPSGALVVQEQIGDISAMKRTADGKLVPTAPAPRNWRSVEDFKKELRALLSRAPGVTSADGGLEWKKPARLPVRAQAGGAP